MHFADCVALVAVLFTTLTENLRLRSFAEAGLFLMFLNFEQKWASCSYKIVLIKDKSVFIVFAIYYQTFSHVASIIM